MLIRERKNSEGQISTWPIVKGSSYINFFLVRKQSSQSNGYWHGSTLPIHSDMRDSITPLNCGKNVTYNCASLNHTS